MLCWLYGTVKESEVLKSIPYNLLTWSLFGFSEKKQKLGIYNRSFFSATKHFLILYIFTLLYKFQIKTTYCNSHHHSTVWSYYKLNLAQMPLPTMWSNCKQGEIVDRHTGQIQIGMPNCQWSGSNPIIYTFIFCILYFAFVILNCCRKEIIILVEMSEMQEHGLIMCSNIVRLFEFFYLKGQVFSEMLLLLITLTIMSRPSFTGDRGGTHLKKIKGTWYPKKIFCLNGERENLTRFIWWLHSVRPDSEVNPRQIRLSLGNLWEFDIGYGQAGSQFWNWGLPTNLAESIGDLVYVMHKILGSN